MAIHTLRNFVRTFRVGNWYDFGGEFWIPRMHGSLD